MDALSTFTRDKLPQIGLAALLGLVVFVEIVAFTFSSVQQSQQSAMW
jgi:hypothetical protein